MKKGKLKLKWKILILLVLLVLIVPFTISFAKYLSNSVQYHQKSSQSFFFTSDLLDSSSEKIHLFDQGGKTFSVYLYNYDYLKNNSVYITDVNISYNVSTSGISGITLSNSSGTITGSSGVKNSAKIDITIPSSYTDGAEFTITASTTSPYTKTLTKTFVLHKKKSGNSYIINDTVGSNYATLIIKTEAGIAANALTFDWTASTSTKGIDLDTTNKYLINSDYSIPSTIASKVSTNKIAINPESQIEIIILKGDKQEYYGTGVEQAISNNKITITKRN